VEPGPGICIVVQAEEFQLIFRDHSANLRFLADKPFSSGRWFVVIWSSPFIFAAMCILYTPYTSGSSHY
jgi:hypothetical protein